MVLVYDHVHSGSTHFFMDPDRTDQYLPRAELSSRREKHREDANNFTQARGYLRAAHIQSRAQTDYGGLQESLESLVDICDRYCRNPYSNPHKSQN